MQLYRRLSSGYLLYLRGLRCTFSPARKWAKPSFTVFSLTILPSSYLWQFDYNNLVLKGDSLPSEEPGSSLCKSTSEKDEGQERSVTPGGTITLKAYRPPSASRTYFMAVSRGTCMVNCSINLKLLSGVGSALCWELFQWRVCPIIIIINIAILIFC